jgi:LemA protein
MGGRKTSLAAPWLILGVAVVGLWIVAAYVRADGPAFPRVVLITCATLWLIWAVRLRSRQWRIDDVPTSECVNVAVGFAEVSGVAQLDPPLAARGSATPCAYFKWELQEYRKTGKNSSWVTVERDETRTPFRVVDTTGAVVVDPEHAEFVGLDSSKSAVPGRSRRWRQIEWRVDIGEPVYVIGPTRVRDDSTQIAFGTDESSDEFIISDESERKVRLRIAFAAWSCSVLGAVGAGLATILRAEPTLDSDGDPSVAYHLVDSWSRLQWFALTSVLVFVGVLGCSWLFRAYNRLVRVRGQAEKAWSLIAVELQRRHNLLEQLINVVRGYATYEQSVQEGLTRHRGELPTAGALADAGVAELGARSQAASLLAVAEAHPDLRASEQFRRLSAAITMSEDRVAAARRFYNDAVTVLRDRRQVFPYVVVAGFVTCPSFDLFEADAPERAVPSVGDPPPVR